MNTQLYQDRLKSLESLWRDADFQVTTWTKERLRASCEHPFMAWVGAGATSKTTDAVALALQFWQENPEDTAIILCSYGRHTLRRRIWGDAVKMFRALPARIRDQSVLNDNLLHIRPKGSYSGGGVFGVALSGVGDIGRIRDIKARRVWLIIDDMDGLSMNVFKNLPLPPVGHESRFLGIGVPLGDPLKRNTPLLDIAAPANGWDSLNPDSVTSWEIPSRGYKGTGLAMFFDGRKSPAFLNPEWGEKNPWMIGRQYIEATASAYGERDSRYWIHAIGWPPPLLGK